MIHDLYTPEGETLQGTPWQVYPRPQLKRNSYVNLNGIWDFAVYDQPEFPAEDLQINVPFCPESLLSGLKMQVKPDLFCSTVAVSLLKTPTADFCSMWVRLTRLQIFM